MIFLRLENIICEVMTSQWRHTLKMSQKCPGGLIIWAWDTIFARYILEHTTNFVTFWVFFENFPYITNYCAYKMAAGSDVTEIKDFLDLIPVTQFCLGHPSAIHNGWPLYCDQWYALPNTWNIYWPLVDYAMISYIYHMLQIEW